MICRFGVGRRKQGVGCGSVSFGAFETRFGLRKHRFGRLGIELREDTAFLDAFIVVEVNFHHDATCVRRHSDNRAIDLRRRRSIRDRGG